MKIESIKYRTGRGCILEGHFIEISTGKFVSVIVGDGMHLINKDEIIEREESSINSQGRWK